MPQVGDLVLCHFPESLLKPKPSPGVHPSIILKLVAPTTKDPTIYRVVVCYGTSNLGRLYETEFEITSAAHSQDFTKSGLNKDTKFNLAQRILLPYTDEWFLVPTLPQFGQTPRIGVLTPAAAVRLNMAWLATSKK